jgi:c-di-GMP-binding flagellar brake protein YcgR
VSAIAEIITELNNNANATVDIPVKKGESTRLKCLLKKTESPEFKLLFPPDTFTDQSPEIGASCRLTVKHGAASVNLKITIDDISGDRTLFCTAIESINPESLREYFRVMISAPIQASYLPGPREIKIRAWKLEGNTIDLSGGGLLALFSAKPSNTKRIQLEIDLPDQQTPVICQAMIVRTYRMRKKRYQVAFHFEEINGKARDAIISCCLQEQRRQLRDNVRIE